LPGNNLLKKLQYKAGMSVIVLNSPAGFLDSLELPPESAPDREIRGQYEFVQLFAENSQVLNRWAQRTIEAVKPEGLLWICYPKMTSGMKTDLTRDRGWQVLADAGLRGIRQVSIDQIWSAVRFKPASDSTGEQALQAQYSGRKAHLEPIKDLLVEKARTLGDDVQVHIRKSYLALARKKQFAVIQPTTNERVDLGLKLEGQPFEGRLQPARNVGSGSMTHCITLHNPQDVEDEVLDFLTMAYREIGD
jgi:hypothetical protein